MKERAKVAILATGGTIAGSHVDPSESVGYRSGVLSADELVAAVPGLREIAEVSTRQVFQIGSVDMSFERLFELAEAVRDALARPDVAGVVVMHGTDTLEESAYFLDLVTHSEKPIVVVGAMRPATAYGADGPMNLLNAVTLAVSPKARGLGVTVVMNNTIHAARFVFKNNTVRPDAFVSGDGPVLGTVVGREILLQTGSVSCGASDGLFAGFVPEGPVPEVRVLYCHGGMDDRQLLEAAAAGCRGLVLAGVGDGSLGERMLPTVRHLCAEGMLVVRATRVPTGPVMRNGEVDDDACGTIPAWTLNPAKARILLTLCLMRNLDASAVAQVFHRASHR